MMRVPRLQHASQRLATGCAIALGFALPVSTAASNILLALALLASLLAGDYRQRWALWRQQPVVLAALALVALAALGCSWGLGDEAARQLYLGKYLTWLALPLLLPLFVTARARQLALQAFVAAMLLTLALSLLRSAGLDHLLPDWLGAHLVPAQDAEHDLRSNAVVFKLSITHSVFMALAAYLLFLAAGQCRTRGWRVLLLGLATLAAVNVLFMVIGRTGYVVLAVLAGYWLLSRHAHARRRLLAGGLLAGVLGVLLWFGSTTLQSRVMEAQREALAWQPGQATSTSIGLRLNYWRTSLAIISQQPFSGVGTGGFAAAYDQQIAGTAMQPAANPHNQYLLTTAQLGLPGLILLLTLYTLIWRESGRLPQLERDGLRGLLLAYLAGNLFNSFMFDFSERYLFVWLTAVLLAAAPWPQAAARHGDAAPGS